MVEATQSSIDPESMDQDCLVDDQEFDWEQGVRIGDIYLPPPPMPACTFENDGPRLVITNIENVNFKSYLGRQILGPFHKSFTSIIGANGSGKSNVIDAMLFVFGYRAQKIRSKKLSVLIHKSSSHQNITSCSVSVYLEKIIDKGPCDFETVPGSGIVISRTAFADNTSHYALNGKRVMFREIGNFLKSEGIDLLNNRFLILQGEVEQISLMKPKGLTENETGMLEYLEDIIGSARFKEPIELLSSRVETLNEQRSDKLNRVKIVEKEKEELSGPKDEALVYLRNENELLVQRNVLLQSELFQSNAALEKAEVDKQHLSKELSAISLDLNHIVSERTAKAIQVSTLSSKLSSLNTTKDYLSDKLKEFKIIDLKKLGSIDLAAKRKITATKLLQTENDKMNELLQLPTRNTALIERLSVERAEMESARVEAESHYESVMGDIQEQTADLQEQKDGLEKRLAQIHESVDKAKSNMDSAGFDLKMYVRDEKNETEKLASMLTFKESLSKQLQEKTTQYKQYTSQHVEYTRLLDETGKSLETRRSRVSELEQSIRAARGQLEHCKMTVAQGQTRSAVLSALMEQKYSGSLSGVFGRLGDLGAIDDKYDVAISTACGTLDNIVVDTVNTAQRCIDFLRERNIGRATFIALEKMQHWQQHTRTRITMPEAGVTRLFDLVRVQDERVLTAFYYALRDTLVASDLSQATRIGYSGQQRHRVVTLKGELIEPQGTMSGGGKNVARGRMGTTLRQAHDTSMTQKEVQAVEFEVKQKSEELARLVTEKQELESRVSRLRSDLNSSAQNKQKLQLEVNSIKEQLNMLEKQIETQQKIVDRVKPDKQKLKRLEAVLQTAQNEYNESLGSTSGLKEEIKAVNEKIVQITGDKVKAAETKLNECVRKLDKLNAEIVKLSTAIKTVNRNVSKAEDKIRMLNQDISDADSEIQTIEISRNNINTEIEESNIKLKEIIIQLNTDRKQFAELKAELNVFSTKEKEVNVAKVDKEQQLDKVLSRLKESHAMIRILKNKLTKLTLNKIPDSDICDKDVCEFKTLSDEEIIALDVTQINYKISSLEDTLKKLKPDFAAMEEYRKKEALYMSRLKELEEITKQRDEQRGYYDQLRTSRLHEFMAGFKIITTKLKEMYQMITLGGDAELELVDSLDPFSDGIEFSVRPPKKSWKRITNLSGGEKTLSSLSLVFALHYYKPTPFYVMDEIDAALDFKNVSIIANYIKERTKNAQFLIISLRSQMFELADRLIGIFKTNDATQSVFMNNFH